MQHVPATALVPTPPRHARLFELIRQENLAQERAISTRRVSAPSSVSDFLKQTAQASLKRSQ